MTTRIQIPLSQCSLAADWRNGESQFTVNNIYTGAQLLENKAIDFYSFTGRTRVGRVVHAGAGLRTTHVELGSNAWSIVCAGANLSAMQPKLVNASFRRAGQFCTSVQRLYVQASRADEVIDAFASVANAIHAAIDEDIFVPVVSVIPFEDIRGDFAESNRLPCGFAAGVFTQNIGLAAARTLRMGSVHITASSRTDNMPYGGVKDSSYGREGPRYAIQEMTEKRLVTLRPSRGVAA